LILFLSRFLEFPQLFLTIDFLHLPYEMLSLWNSIEVNQFVSLLISCIYYITLNAYFHCILFLLTWKKFPLMTFSFLCLKFCLNNHHVHLLKTIFSLVFGLYTSSNGSASIIIVDFLIFIMLKLMNGFLAQSMILFTFRNLLQSLQKIHLFYIFKMKGRYFRSFFKIWSYYFIFIEVSHCFLTLNHLFFYIRICMVNICSEFLIDMFRNRSYVLFFKVNKFIFILWYVFDSSILFQCSFLFNNIFVFF
jgi:hypothetical protein